MIATGASENRAALDRTRVRWIALKRDVQDETHRRAAEASDAWTRFADEFRQQFEAWEAFYRDSYDNLMGDLWPISDLGTEIERWDATLTAYSSRFRSLADREPTGVTDADTAPRTPLAPPSFSPFGDAIEWLAIAGIVIALAWGVSSAASVMPAVRLAGAR